MVLYKFALDVILVHLNIFVISLTLSTYISSVMLVTSINFHSINQIKKIGHKDSSPSTGFVIFSPSSSFSCIFLVDKQPLMMKNQGMLS